MPVIFTADEGGQVVRLNLMQYEFFKRPFKESLRLKVFAALGSLAGLLLAALGMKMLKK